MGILDSTGAIERLSFFNGQRLFASDLQAIDAFHREMRWLHNQSLHQPGIGKGFAVSGKRDDRKVRVGPGYALDADGREIVLTRERVEQVPPVASEDGGQSVFFDLAVSYPGDELLEEAETREGICLPRGAVRLREEPVLCWLRLKRDAATGQLAPVDSGLGEEVQKGLRIVLARIEVLQCRLRQDVSLAERRSARPASQPRIVCGRQGYDPEKWIRKEFDKSVTLTQLTQLTVKVDTSSAGFFTTPCYSVRLDGTRVKHQNDNENQPIEYIVLDNYPTIIDQTPTGFTLKLFFWLLQGPSDDPFKGWEICWMGVE